MTDDGLQRIVELTRNLMVIPSSWSRPDERRRCMDQVRNHVDSLPDIRIREFEVEGAQSLLATPESDPDPEVLLIGHLDVVDHPDESVYRSRVEDGRIYGPGAGDMKGALAILMEVFRQIHGRSPRASLGLAVTSDEETGGQHGVRHLVQDQGLRCGVAVIPDGGSLHHITVEEKGLIHLGIRAQGHSAHAARPWLGDNAVERLMDRLAAVRAYFQALKSGDDGWLPTCAVTGFHTQNRTSNCIPCHAEAVLDVRYPHPFTANQLVTEIRSLLGRDTSLEIVVSSLPSHLDPDPLYLQVTEQITQHPVELTRSEGSSDARYLSELGIPVIMARPQVGNLHATDEWIQIESMDTLFQIYDSYIAKRLNLTPLPVVKKGAEDCEE